MKKLFLFSAVFLLSALGAKAQETFIPDFGSEEHWADTDTNYTTLVGMVSQSENGYSLVDDSGMAYRLVGDTSGLKRQIGNTIKVTGTAASASSDMQPEINVISFKKLNG
jgi:hypothetical protein